MTSGDPPPFGTSSGTATITVSAGDELCFIAASKFSDGLNSAPYTLNNFVLPACPGVLTASIVATTDTLACFGDTDGSILVTPSGGSGGFTYTWDNAVASGDNPMNLPAGTYCVTVTDALGNTTSGCATIVEPTELTSSAIVDSNVSCNGGNDGQATASQSGGTMGYTYAWDNMETTATATALSSGMHTVTITDANVCESIAMVDITEPDELSIMMTSTAELDMNGDGTATATVGGGTPGYTYSWNTNPIQTDSSATGLTGGTYIVTATDSNGCEIVDSVVVDQMTGLEDFSEITHFNLYPNPSDGKVFLELDLERSIDIKIQLFNSLGQEVKAKEIQRVNSIREEYNWTEFPNGIYWLRLSSSEKQMVQKIIFEQP